MTDWASLRDAYGLADDIPARLAAVESSGPEEADRLWHDLWGRLCHQGSVYSASYAAVPLLAGMAAKEQPGPLVQPLHLAAAILGSPNHSEDVAVIRRRYAAEIASLRELAESFLAAAAEPRDFVWSLQALMAFEDVPFWQHELQGLAEGEIGLECPNCGDEIFVVTTDPARVTDDDDGFRSVVVPASPLDLTGAEARMYRLTMEHHQQEVAVWLLNAFGRFECPACDEAFQLCKTG